MEKTTITVSHDCWERINSMRKVGDSMEDVIMRALLEEPTIKSKGKKK